MGKKIAIIGGGNLGSAIAEGLIKSGFSTAQEIVITKRNTSTPSLQPLKDAGINVIDDNLSAVNNSEVTILAVKPFQVSEVLTKLSSAFTENKMLISVVTGVLISDMEPLLEVTPAIFRAMPNTAIAIQQSMTCICNKYASAEQETYVHELFEKLGKVVSIEEKLMEAATILGACGIAYALRFIRANIQGGIEIGFDAATANLVATQTIKGAAELLLQTGRHPEQEIDKVTTPKGCTIAGLNEMEHRGFSSSLIRGVVASYKKIAKD